MQNTPQILLTPLNHVPTPSLTPNANVSMDTADTAPADTGAKPGAPDQPTAKPLVATDPQSGAPAAHRYGPHPPAEPVESDPPHQLDPNVDQRGSMDMQIITPTNKAPTHQPLEGTGRLDIDMADIEILPFTQIQPTPSSFVTPELRSSPTSPQPNREGPSLNELTPRTLTECRTEVSPLTDLPEDQDSDETPSKTQTKRKRQHTENDAGVRAKLLKNSQTGDVGLTRTGGTLRSEDLTKKPIKPIQRKRPLLQKIIATAPTLQTHGFELTNPQAKTAVSLLISITA